jgi:hypothetical protein
MQEYNYRAITFCRPGEAGIVPLVGALWAAENNGLLSEVVAWICPSTTSLISIMSICGYKCIEIMAILSGVPELLLPPIPFKNPVSLGNSIDSLKNKFYELIKNKLNKIPTLQELQDDYETIVVTVGFTLEKQETEYINASTYPEMSLVDFLCISFSTPGIFRPYKYEHNNWIDGSIIECFPVGSIDLDKGKILGLSTSQNIVTIGAKDPLNQVKNIMRSAYEATRFSNIKDYPNLTNVILPVDDFSIYETSDIPTPFTNRILLQLGDTITGKLKCGWIEFMKIHFDSIRETEEEEAEKQE